MISSASELNEISHFLANQKLLELVRNIDELNPKQMEATMTRRSDIFVIYLGDDYPRRPRHLLSSNVQTKVGMRVDPFAEFYRHFRQILKLV